MTIQCRIVAVPAIVLAMGGILAGCPLPDARLEELVATPCTNDDDCDDGNPCTHDACNAETSHCAISALDSVAPPQAEKGNCFERICQKGIEVKVPVAMGIPAVQQIVGDCLKMLCDGAGNQTTVDDAADVPNDANDCTLDVCDGSVVMNSALAIGTPCGADGKSQCNGLGQCVGCTSDAQCSDGGNFCVVAACNMNQICGMTPKSAGTELPSAAQIPQDCRRQICDDSGHMVEIFDPFDAPDDGNDCTDDMCNAGKPVYPPTAAGEPCGPGGVKVCDGLGNCRSKISDPCSNDMECVSGFCVDGFCCNANCSGTCQACSAAKKGQGINGACEAIVAGLDPDIECAPQAASTCGTTGVCNGSGACAKHAAGTVCNAASCMGSTIVQADTCDGGGTCVDGGTTSCGAASYCVAAQCFPKKQNSAICGGPGECISGNCVDGVCCNSSCNSQCVACNVNGFIGTCKPVPFPITDTACSVNEVCNGNGSCKFANGRFCSSNTHCASGTCSAGVCKSVAGQPCAASVECANTICVNNVCQ